MLKNNIKIQIFLVYLLSRVVILFTPTLGNHPEFIDVILKILAGQNPYTSAGAEYINFPPFHYLIYAFFIFIFGPTNFAFKMCTFVFDIGTVLVLYKIASLLGNYKEREWVPAMFFAFFPTTLLVAFISVATLNSVFFFMLAIYCFLKKRFFFMGIFAGLGTLTEIFPIFLIYLLSIIFFAKRQFQNLFQTLLGFACAYLSITIPFFGVNVLDALFIHLMRQTTGLSVVGWLPDWIIVLPMGLELNIYAIITVSVILAVGAWTYVYSRHNELSEKKQIQICLWFYLFLPVLFLNVYDRYFLWALPLLVILVDIPQDENLWRRTLIFLTLGFIPAVIGIFSIYPNATFQNVQDFFCGNVGYPPCTYIIVYDLFKRKAYSSDPQLNMALLVYFILYTVLLVIWMIKWGKILTAKSRLNSQNRVYYDLVKVSLLAGLLSNGELLLLLTPGLPTWLMATLFFSGTGVVVFLIIHWISRYYLFAFIMRSDRLNV